MGLTTNVTLTLILWYKGSISLKGSIRNATKPLSRPLEIPDALQPNTIIFLSVKTIIGYNKLLTTMNVMASM